jgi:hypothetical protein
MDQNSPLWRACGKFAWPPPQVRTKMPVSGSHNEYQSSGWVNWCVGGGGGGGRCTVLRNRYLNVETRLLESGDDKG